MKSKNSAVRVSFVEYCKKHPDQRFWQALRNWSGYTIIYATNELPTKPVKDTFYWEGRRYNAAEAGVPGTKIEVTPDMIEAGAGMLASFDRRIWDNEAMAELIYEAMETVRQTCRTASNSQASASRTSTKTKPGE